MSGSSASIVSRSTPARYRCQLYSQVTRGLLRTSFVDTIRVSEIIHDLAGLLYGILERCGLLAEPLQERQEVGLELSNPSNF